MSVKQYRNHGIELLSVEFSFKEHKNYIKEKTGKIQFVLGNKYFFQFFLSMYVRIFMSFRF
jgi:hypothetical protein